MIYQWYEDCFTLQRTTKIDQKYVKTNYDTLTLNCLQTKFREKLRGLVALDYIPTLPPSPNYMLTITGHVMSIHMINLFVLRGFSYII